MHKCVFRVLSGCHYWNPNILQVTLLGCGQEERFPGWKWQTTGKLTYLSPLSKKRCLLPSRSLQFAVPMSQGTPRPLHGNSLLHFLKMLPFHTKQDRSSRCHLSFLLPFLLFSWALNKKHIQWKLIRKSKYRWLCWPIGTEFSTALGYGSYS